MTKRTMKNSLEVQSKKILKATDGLIKTFVPIDENSGWIVTYDIAKLLDKWKNKTFFSKRHEIVTKDEYGQPVLESYGTDSLEKIYYRITKDSIRICAFKITYHQKFGMRFNKKPHNILHLKVTDKGIKVMHFGRDENQTGKNKKTRLHARNVTYMSSGLQFAEMVDRQFSALTTFSKDDVSRKAYKLMQRYIDKFAVKAVNKLIRNNLPEYKQSKVTEGMFNIQEVAFKANYTNCPEQQKRNFQISARTNPYMAKLMKKSFNTFLTYVYGTKGKMAKELFNKTLDFNAIRKARVVLLKNKESDAVINKVIHSLVKYSDLNEMMVDPENKRIPKDHMCKLVKLIAKIDSTKDREGYYSRGNKYDYQRRLCIYNDQTRYIVDTHHMLLWTDRITDSIDKKVKEGKLNREAINEYVTLLAKLELCLTRKRIKDYHDSLSIVFRDLRLLERNVKFNTDLWQKLDGYHFQHGGTTLQIEFPKETKDLVSMGAEMRNCVASYEQCFTNPSKHNIVFVIRDVIANQRVFCVQMRLKSCKTEENGAQHEHQYYVSQFVTHGNQIIHDAFLRGKVKLLIEQWADGKLISQDIENEDLEIEETDEMYVANQQVIFEEAEEVMHGNVLYMEDYHDDYDMFRDGGVNDDIMPGMKA